MKVVCFSLKVYIFFDDGIVVGMVACGAQEWRDIQWAFSKLRYVDEHPSA